MDIPMAAHSKDDFMKPWKFRSNSAISISFSPQNTIGITMAISWSLRSNQHQVFGHSAGYFLIEGKQIAFEDLSGFAEKVFNKW
jgi:hypothetical protein